MFFLSYDPTCGPVAPNKVSAASWVISQVVDQGLPRSRVTSQLLDQRSGSHLQSLAEAAVQALVHIELLHEACITGQLLSPCRQKYRAGSTHSSAAMMLATAGKGQALHPDGSRGDDRLPKHASQKQLRD